MPVKQSDAIGTVQSCPFTFLQTPEPLQIRVPLLSHVSGSTALTTDPQRPVPIAQRWQLPVHELAQQTPSMQLPKAHPPDEQGWPTANPHAPLLQTFTPMQPGCVEPGLAFWQVPVAHVEQVPHVACAQQTFVPGPVSMQFGAAVGHCSGREQVAPGAKSFAHTPLLHHLFAGQSLSVLHSVQPDPSGLQTFVPQSTQLAPQCCLVLHVSQLPELHHAPGVWPLPSEQAGLLPQRQPLPPMPQLFAVSELHGEPQVVQLLKSLLRLRQAACDEQQLGSAPNAPIPHCPVPSSATPFEQLLSTLSQSSGAPG